MEVRFYIGCESGEVENYDDFKYWEDNFPYSAKKEPRECKTVIESLARQIGIPSDMQFEKVERDWRKGIWVGEFIRIKDGYRYELDNVAIGISDKTRKLAATPSPAVPTDADLARKAREHMVWAFVAGPEFRFNH